MKVPNVKLRPAAPVERTNRSRNDTPPLWARDMGLESEQEVSAIDLCPRPFRGVVVCATGIEDKVGRSFYTCATIELQALHQLVAHATSGPCCLKSRGLLCS